MTNFCVPSYFEQFRITQKPFGPGNKKNGIFLISHMGLKIIASEGGDWQHVSVSRQRRAPSYYDMVYVKKQFWSDDVTVMQLHVPSKDHVNMAEHCLHLWRPLKQEIPTPPKIFV